MRTRKMKILLFASLVLSFGALAFACKCDCGKSTPKTPKLLAPEISAQDSGIYWTSAKDATGYKVCFNAGEWQDVAVEEKMVSYPTEKGSYTLQVVSVASGYQDSDPVEFEFTVDALQIADCTQVDNAITFIGENILCSVNDGEFAELPESQVLDFSAAPVGSPFSVKYYAKGGYWDETKDTYYIDSEVKNAALTVTQALAAPVLEVDSARKGVTWAAVQNAGDYQVNVDGEVSTITISDERFVAFPQNVGAHTITVKALKNGNYTQSAESAYAMETKEFGTPIITYNKDEQKVIWDAKYTDYMLSSTGGEYAKVNASQIAYVENLSLKLSSHYDQMENVLYLDSKTLSCKTREVPTITFHSNGSILWDEENENQELEYYYSVGAEGEADAFARTDVNALDVSNYQANTYTLKVYAAGYVEELENTAILWLQSENGEITFKVLDAPKLAYTTNKLLWTVDENATAYECKVGDSEEWVTATETGAFEATEFTTYYLKAIGNEAADNYVVNSGISELYFDPTLQNNELAKFDDEKYLAKIGTSLEANTTNSGTTSIVTTGANETETAILAGAEDGKVLKLTAGSAAPRVEAEWGNSDGFAFNFFSEVDISGYTLVVRMYMKSNPNRENGKDGSGPANVEGLFNYYLKSKTLFLSGWSKQIAVDQWVDYVISVPATWSEALHSLSINFHDNGQAGDAIYIDSIKLMDTRTTETNIDFSKYDSVPAFVSCNREITIAEGQLTNNSTLWNKDSMVISYRALELKAGDTITVTATTVGNGMNIDLNGKYYKWVGANTTASVTITLTEAITLETIAFRCSSANGATYKIASIVIEKATQVETYAPLSIDFSQYTKVPVFVTSDKGVNIVDGELTNNEYKLYNGENITISYGGIQLKAGDTITITVTTVGNGMNIDLNGTYYKWVGANTTTTVTITLAEAMTLDTIAFRCSSANGATYKIASVVITQA